MAELVTLALVGLASLLLLLLVILSRRSEGPKAPPVVRTGLPLVGPMVEFSTAPFQFLRRMQKQYGQVFTLDLLFSKMTFILGKEGNKTFFDAPDDVMDFNSAVAVVTQNVLGSDAFTMDLTWNEKSSGYISKGFMKYERLNQYSMVIRDEVEKHIKNWLNEDKIDLFPAVSQLITSINIRCILGEDAYNNAGKEIASLYYEIEHSALDPVSILLPSLPTPTKARMTNLRTRLTDIVSNLIKERPDDQDTLDYLGMVWQQEKLNHSPNILVVHMLGIMFAAHTNTAGTTGWLLAHFANDKALPEKALREQKSVAAEMGDEAQQLSPNFISKLEFLDACVKETVRRHGMLMLVRKAVKDVPFRTASGQEFIIPCGRTVACSPALTHFNEEVFPDPQRYDPERFTNPERKQSLVASRNYVQFGFGRHKCLGERFALLVIKTTVSRILELCEMELLEPLPEANYCKQTGTPAPLRPVWVKCKPC